MKWRGFGMSGEASGTNGRGDLALFMAIATTGVVIALVNATSGVMEAIKYGEARPAWHDFLYEFSSNAVWIALIPLIMRLQRRWPFAPPWVRTLALHGALTAPI